MTFLEGKKLLHYGGAWKECPGNVNLFDKYSVDERDTRIATRINGNDWRTIIGNTSIPLKHNCIVEYQGTQLME